MEFMVYERYKFILPLQSSSAFIPNFLFRTDEYIGCSGIIWEEEIKL